MAECPQACDVGLTCPDAGDFESVVVANTTESANLCTGAWCVLDFSPLKSWAIRGADLLVPGADGVLQRDRLTDKLEVTLRMGFAGDVDPAGTSYAPETVCYGLERNRRDFLALAVIPGLPRTLTITWADGTTLGAVPISVEGFDWSDEAYGRARAVWRISLPDGPPV